LPPLRRIIPTIHAEWNVKKTASDTTTKLIDGSCNQIRPPSAYINTNTLVSARTINYSLVTCHRLRQLFSSSPEKSESLRDFRNSANNRMTYNHSIKAAAKCILSMVEEIVSSNEQGMAEIMDKTVEQIRRVRIQGALTTNKIILPERHPIAIQSKGTKMRITVYEKKLLSEGKIAEGL
jgi:hypothetical protein